MRSLEGSIILSVLVVIKILVHKGVSGSGIQYAPQNTEMERMGFSPRTTISFSKDDPVHTTSSSMQRAQLLTHLPGLGLSPGVAPTTTSGEQSKEAGSDLEGAVRTEVRCRRWDGPQWCVSWSHLLSSWRASVLP